MKLVVQYVTNASSHPGGVIHKGYAVLVGINKSDTQTSIATMAQKLLNLRCIPDNEDKINLSIQDIKGEILLISQFTLYADTTKGNRPSFGHAASPETANQLFKEFVKEVQKSGLKVETGVFRTHMQVTLTNDGPITIILEN